MFFHPINDQEK